MRTVYKYPFEIDDLVALPMPAGAELLSVQMQGDTPCIWAIVDDNRERVRRGIAVRGTGHPMNGREGNFVGTIQMAGGRLVFHVFDAGEIDP